MSETEQLKDKDSTKERILNAANILFASKGFGGTSIREIAKTANVNLGAVNYHFETKENLYFEIFHLSLQETDLEIKELASKLNPTTAELSWQVFQFFLNNGMSTKNIFKMFLNDSAELPDDFFKTHPAQFGPPGEEVFFKVISQEVGENVSMGAKLWAVKTIFAYMAHMSLVMNTKFCQKMLENSPDLACIIDENSMNMHVEAILNYIQTKKEGWEDLDKLVQAYNERIKEK